MKRRSKKIRRDALMEILKKKEKEENKELNKEEEKKIKNIEGYSDNPLKIRPFKTKASNHQTPPLMEQIGIKVPFSMAIFGMTGSGKSVLCCSFLCNPFMFRNYFSKIILFSPTGKLDDTFEHLGLPENQIISEDFESKLEEIIEEQKEKIEEEGMTQDNNMLILFEDLTSLKKELMNTKAFISAFVQNRHLNISSIAVCHKYNSLVRTARLNSHHIFLFPCSGSEIEVLRNEHQPPNMSNEEFNNLIGEAFRPEEKNTHPFLWVNLKENNMKKRFRKSLDAILTYETNIKKEQIKTPEKREKISVEKKQKKIGNNIKERIKILLIEYSNPNTKLSRKKRILSLLDNIENKL